MTKESEADISDPEVYWPMAMYADRVRAVLMMLRHLYEPTEAVKWLNESQKPLDNDVPAELLLSLEGTSRVKAVIARILDGAYS